MGLAVCRADKHVVQFCPGNIACHNLISGRAEFNGYGIPVILDTDINALMCKVGPGIAFLPDCDIFLSADGLNVTGDKAIHIHCMPDGHGAVQCRHSG